MWFKDGYYPILIPENGQDIKGKKLIAINKHLINEVVDSLSTLIGETNEALLKKQFPNYVTHIALLEYFKFLQNDTIQLIFQGENGDKSSLIYSKDIRNNILKYGMPKMLQTNTSPLYWSNMDKIFWMEIIDSENILYVGYNKCFGKEVATLCGYKNVENLPSFQEFTQRLFSCIDTSSFDKLIFDLRLNAGGSSIQGTKLIDELAKYDVINTKGKLFVVIGRRTYSSGLINALDFKNKTEAILVGESTSGKPNHYGEVKQFQLPKSGININYSSDYFKYLKEDPNSLCPDIYVEPTYNDFENGEDPVLKIILEYED
ncbi:S41 family peptidase [Plebeiibacterium sediminum]|uniref:S41 family peptidase n=1 Tax=Plebeiibacterium sediminum TaxID=2992112 RepID=A0AAE3M9B3_9BACT|nr:S41 family peptidase [Plebeiobacterium sediminum]MCW3789641.1 S41 family peptidase [Plebeiobacterium sediminum]